MAGVRIAVLVALLAACNARPEQPTSVATCDLTIDVVYPEGEQPYPVCSENCPSGDQSGSWFEGVAYKRFCDLEPLSLMVEARYEDGQFAECVMVPYQTSEQLIAKRNAAKASLEACAAEADFPQPSTAATIEVSSTTTEEPTITITTMEPTTTTTTEEPTTTTTTEEPTTTTTTTTTEEPTTTTTTTTEEPTTTTTTTTTTPKPLVRKCAEGFTMLDGGCYMVTPGRASEQDSASYCKKYFSEPAIINSAQEQKTLADHLTKTVWIGLSDRASEGHFVWQDGTSLGYFAWNGGEPNNVDNEDCVTISQPHSFNWNDQKCGNSDRMLCEHEPFVSYPEYTCPTGYFQREDSCYRVSDTAGDYARGEQYCSSEGAYPAYINSQQEQDFLAARMGESVFIGYTDKAEEGTFISDKFGVPFFTAWYHNEPNDANDGEDCTEMLDVFNYKWNDCKCSLTKKVLCEKAATPVQPTVSCPNPDESLHDGHCYFASGSSLKRSLADSNEYCQARGSALASIHSSQEQNFVKTITSGSTWIGFVDKRVEGDFGWYDGTPSDFTNWSGGEPNNAGDEDCTEVRSDRDYQWNDASCDNSNSFLCKRMANVA